MEPESNRADRSEGRIIARLRAIYLRGKEKMVALRRAQTMTEYALILAAVAAVVYVAYHTMGSDVFSMVIWTIIAGDLTGS